MKTVATFAVAVLACVPALAQFGGGGGGPRAAQRMPAPNIEIELLEMEQEADKEALKEALLGHAGLGMKPVGSSERDEKLRIQQITVLREFIATKKETITKRAAEIAEKRQVLRPRQNTPRANPPQERERQAAVESYEKSRLEAALIQAKINLLSTPMHEATQALAKAEIAADTNESKRPEAVAARKEFERLKAKNVELNQQMQLEQRTMESMRMMGMGTPGGMM